MTPTLVLSNLQLWLRKKAIAEKATQLLRKLDATRADEDETWRATAVSLHAVEALLKSQGGGIKSGLRKAWVEWTKKHHRFGEIKISRDEAFDRLTGGARSMLQKVEDGFVIYGLVYVVVCNPLLDMISVNSVRAQIHIPTDAEKAGRHREAFDFR